MKIGLQQYWNLLVEYLKPQGGSVAKFAMALLGSIGLQLVNPQILRYFIDTAVAGGSGENLFLAALVFITVALITQLMTIAATYYGENIAWRATNALRADLVDHCLQLDLSFHKFSTPGELLERVDGDVHTMKQFFSRLSVHIFGNLLLMSGVIVVFFAEDWRAGLAIAFFSLTALSTLIRLRSIAVPHWRTYRQISADFFGFVGEQLAGMEDIRANGAKSYVMQRFHKILQSWLPIFHQARFASTILWGTTNGIFTLGTTIALSVGAYLWSQNIITIGTVYLLYYYTNLLREPIEQIRDQFEDLQQAEASIYRIQDLLAVKSQLTKGGEQKLPHGALAVTFNNISFSYNHRESGVEDLVLQDISFNLPAGQVLGLLGRTGSGKSSLARLLLRLYDPQSGSIELGGVAINQVPMTDLPKHVGLVTQDVQLFQTTVRNNLTFFDHDISEERIYETLEILGLSQWLYSLPQGLDTNLGPDSSGLSAGQAQLLAFTRVFLKEPGLVILDEASSRLDPITEKLVERAVDKLLTRRTGIIIAHRLATVQRANQILILEQGRVSEYGQREELVKNSQSRFAQLLQTGFNDLLT
ncbi:ABC transporter ATP-binding protein [Umezakia ovalisporum]|jgi:ATP-binding cassette subfamily B protein/ATP-binding cassette subfamily C protein|uniref:ABC transporter ATP-binding protein/permease n=2 Tax=Umezakia ovalisporum TaxID=75695 RepID=A0AA43KF34_9CYAN|nr:ABC transporter ATP-binding protein [Umezakia ovalisporum]MBI1241613.1 ATP-binding cassette domain-containing protein [Nostoc sp. RI_552]MDH6057367.1 ABC transporter ATP-binding protein/permease [Umezakia ovalisporum FSS-43]MDH6063568.1 ABC transporter ATP-binding protein/permease [Umezakia ovalisporum FSS-62]MDH6072493.1 ABC transporter ATP-binding protein/permease [Umezakia ovalisporum CobakiLakeA]MDH6075558.1 ABC transporter ATP-binding protein/permease [Umezakia ovalisporum CS-1034]